MRADQAGCSVADVRGHEPRELALHARPEMFAERVMTIVPCRFGGVRRFAKTVAGPDRPRVVGSCR
jgi:hypothetical protein